MKEVLRSESFNIHLRKMDLLNRDMHKEFQHL